MSYILEALRRAQTERERGQIPGLHAQAARPEPSPAAAASTLPSSAIGPWMLMAVLLVLLVAGGLWWSLDRPQAPSAVDGAVDGAVGQPTASTSVPVVPARPAPVDASAAAALSQHSAGGVGNALSAAPGDQPLPLVVSAPPDRKANPPPPTSEPASAPAGPAPATGGAAPVVTAQHDNMPTPPSAVLPLAQLGTEQRHGLPALSIGGSVWSDSPASRFVLINGSVVHEGELAAPGVVVERIGPKSAVVRWNSLRIELAL
jgi:general secretion pathway protein B